MALARRLLQALLIASALVVVFLPSIRSDSVRYAYSAVWLVFAVWSVYRLVHSGVGRMTPGQLYASGARADYIEFLTTVLGIVAMALLSFR